VQIQAQTLLKDLSQSTAQQADSRRGTATEAARDALLGGDRAGKGWASGASTRAGGRTRSEASAEAQARREQRAEFADKLRERRERDADANASSTRSRDDESSASELQDQGRARGAPSSGRGNTNPSSVDTTLADAELASVLDAGAIEGGAQVGDGSEPAARADGLIASTGAVGRTGISVPGGSQAVSADALIAAPKEQLGGDGRRLDGIEDAVARSDDPSATLAGAQKLGTAPGVALAALLAPASKSGVQALVRQAGKREIEAGANGPNDGRDIASTDAGRVASIDEQVTFANAAAESNLSDGVRRVTPSGTAARERSSGRSASTGQLEPPAGLKALGDRLQDALSPASTLGTAAQTNIAPPTGALLREPTPGAGPSAPTSSIFRLELASSSDRGQALISGGKQVSESAAAAMRSTNDEAQRMFAMQVDRGVSAALSSNTGMATIRLFPPALGQLRVQVSMDRSAGPGAGSGVSARFDVGSGKARDLLGRSVEQLREALEAKGLTLGGVEVRVQPPMPEREVGLPQVGPELGRMQASSDDARNVEARGQHSGQPGGQHARDSQHLAGDDGLGKPFAEQTPSPGGAGEAGVNPGEDLAGTAMAGTGSESEPRITRGHSARLVVDAVG
jgi:Flagellar hook-length control protein FliK